VAVRVSLRVDERELRRVRDAVALLGAPALYAPVRKFLLSAALLVLDNAAHEQIIGGGRFKTGVGLRGGKKLESAAPHPSRLTSRSGELRRSLGAENSGRGVDDSGVPQYIDVGTDLVYGPVHELGLRGYPRRAFLAPAYNAVSPRFQALLYNALKRELDARGVPN